MRTIGRRAILALGAIGFPGMALLVRGAEEETPFTVLAKLATALSENDADAALELFDPAMSGYGEIESRIEALTSQSDIDCSLDIVTDNESEGVHKLDVDWLFQLKSQADSAQVERRRQRVRIEMRIVKKHWRITALSPLTILDPVAVR